MAFFMIWVIIVIFIVCVNVSKAAGKSQNRNGATPNAPRTVPVRRPVQNKPRSFAAMPEQKSAVPNVETNCSAEDHHRFENNLSRFNKKKLSAIPNVPNSGSHIQPKMSGNRKAARQLYIGDIVPQGMRAVRCSYCAADNLIPHGHSNSYKCYFCHYDI